MRYVGWFRFNGPADTPHDLIDLGRQLLGYLDTQRKLSGVRTIMQSVDTPNGRVVAAFYGSIPVIDCIPTATAEGALAGSTALDLYGPIFTQRSDSFADGYPATLPSGDSTFHHELLLYTDGNTIKPGFYTRDYAPADFKGLEYRYVNGRADAPPLNGHTYPGFTNGLDRFGNIDWTNADESLSVTWFGPIDRHFSGTGGGGDPFGDRVFYRGTPIYIMPPAGDDHVHGNHAVIGACIRRTPGTARTVGRNVFLGLQLIVVVLDATLMTIHVWAAQIFADTSSKTLLATDTAVLLASATTVVANGFNYPAFFNSSGTEGKIVSAGVLETTISISGSGEADVATITVENITPSDTTLSGTTTIRNDWAPFNNFRTAGVTVGASTYWAPLGGFTWEDTVHLSYEFSMENDSSTSITTSQDYKVAVDYQGDTPVYATVRKVVGPQSSSYLFTPFYTIIIDYMTSDNHGVCHDRASSTIASSSSEVSQTLLVLPWGNVVLEDVNNSSVVNQSLSGDIDVADDPAQFSTVIGGGANVDAVPPVNDQVSSTLSYSSDITQSNSRTTRAINYLDLRHEIVAYKTTEVTSGASASRTTDLIFHCDASFNVDSVTYTDSPSSSPLIETTVISHSVYYGGTTQSRTQSTTTSTTTLDAPSMQPGAPSIGDHDPRGVYFLTGITNVGTTTFDAVYGHSGPGTPTGIPDVDNYLVDVGAGNFDAVTAAETTTIGALSPPSASALSPTWTKDDGKLYHGSWLKVKGHYLISQPWPESATPTEYLNIFETYVPTTPNAATGANQRYFPISYLPPHAGKLPS